MNKFYKDVKAHIKVKTRSHNLFVLLVNEWFPFTLITLFYYRNVNFSSFIFLLLVINNSSPLKCNNNRRKAEVNMDGQFLVRQIYDDEITYNLVGAAVEVLSKSFSFHFYFFIDS